MKNNSARNGHGIETDDMAQTNPFNDRHGFSMQPIPSVRVPRTAQRHSPSPIRPPLVILYSLIIHSIRDSKRFNSMLYMANIHNTQCRTKRLNFMQYISSLHRARCRWPFVVLLEVRVRVYRLRGRHRCRRRRRRRRSAGPVFADSVASHFMSFEFEQEIPFTAHKRTR